MRMHQELITFIGRLNLLLTTEILLRSNKEFHLVPTKCLNSHYLAFVMKKMFLLCVFLFELL
jgi:hypothetical protein